MNFSPSHSGTQCDSDANTLQQGNLDIYRRSPSRERTKFLPQYVLATRVNSGKYMTTASSHRTWRLGKPPYHFFFAAIALFCRLPPTSSALVITIGTALDDVQWTVGTKAPRQSRRQAEMLNFFSSPGRPPTCKTRRGSTLVTRMDRTVPAGS